MVQINKNYFKKINLNIVMLSSLLGFQACLSLMRITTVKYNKGLCKHAFALWELFVTVLL